MAALDQWHEFVKSHDLEALWAMLAPDAVFESPVLHTPKLGRDVTFKYLLSAMVVLGGEAFRYVGEWRNDTGAVLEFETKVDGVHINGVDIITWNQDGQISRFKVMVRPLKAISLLHQKMAAELMKS